jgi:hypothetical protein
MTDDEREIEEPEFNAMGADDADDNNRTSLHVTLGEEIRTKINSDEYVTRMGVARLNSEDRDGPVTLLARSHSLAATIEISMSVESWGVEVYATLEDARKLRDQLDGTIRDMEEAEERMANL